MHCFLLGARQPTISIGLRQPGHSSCSWKMGCMENHIVWSAFWIFSTRELSYVPCDFYVLCICNFTGICSRSLFILCVRILTTAFRITCFPFLGEEGDAHFWEDFYFAVTLSAQCRLFINPLFWHRCFHLWVRPKKKSYLLLPPPKKQSSIKDSIQ